MAGINIAIKIPPHPHEAMVAFYRDVVGLKPVETKSGESGSGSATTGCGSTSVRA
jgi:hypothetical protein